MAYVNVAEWKPEQVTEWLKGLDNSILTYVHSFLNNEVNGQQLLNIRPDDLDHLGVQKLGHQELILEAVENLRNFHYELDRENLQLLALRLSCRARSLYNELINQEDSEPVRTQTLADVAGIITTVKPIACWLGRSPFAGHSDYHHRKMELLNLSLEIATCAHRDRFAERPVEEIRKSCDKLASLADSIICDIQDPLLLQPASLDLATVKKRAGDDLGFYIQPSFHGIHQISELKFNSPAQQCGKIEEGDEIVQVNYQTVVGWQSKKVTFLLEESLTDVFLTLKKCPRHTKVYGQIYIKPYRLPSKKRATPYTRWHENLPSPRPELLTIPDFEIPLPRSLPKPGITQPEVHLSDSEPLACSSSSGDDDEDDATFLPGAADLSQASPTSMRLYVPKQRSSVQRRATVTGASPTNRRPPVNIEQLWRELQVQHQWHGPEQNLNSSINSDLCQLREKSHGMSNSLVSVNDVLRPSTCLGIEQSMKNSFRREKQKHLKEKKNVPHESDENRKENIKFVEVRSCKDPPLTDEKKISNVEFEKTVRICDKIPNNSSHVHAFSFTRANSEEGYSKRDITENHCFKDCSKDPTCNNALNITLKDRAVYSPTNFSSSIVNSSISYHKDITKENSCAEEKTNYTMERNLDSSLRGNKIENCDQYPIDENALRIPYGNMKFIDDTSDTNLNKEYGDDYDNFISAEDTKLIQKLPNVPLYHESRDRSQVTNGLHTYPGSCVHRSSGNISDNKSDIKKRSLESSCINVTNVLDKVINSHLECSTEDKNFNQTLSNQSVYKKQPERSNSTESLSRSAEAKQFLSGKSKSDVKKTLNNSSINVDNNISNSISNFSYRNKFAQSLSHLGCNKAAPSSVHSPKTLKRRNVLLAKRRNVNLKDLGQADCEGWLLHRCRWSGTGASLGTTWTRAWFVLKGSIFYGFKSPHASKANIMISLPGFTVSIAEEVKSKKFAFKVYHTGTVFYFAAESEQLLMQWLDAISLGIVVQDVGKTFCSEDAFFSETDDDSDHEKEKDSGNCFPSPKTYKFSNFLGGSNSPLASCSQQNLASETKVGYEVQKKFGSLKKLGRKVTEGGGNSSHSEGGNSSSLDRKYLCFLGSGRNSTVPVPTAHFRSYRRVPNSSPHKVLLNSTRKIIEPHPKGAISGTSTYNCLLDPSKELSRKTNSIGNIGFVESTEIPKHTQEKVRSSNCNNTVITPNSGIHKINDKETHLTPSKSPISDEFLRPVKLSDLRDRSTHASNPTLQLAGDLSDYRLAAERLREFSVQRNRPREDTSGFVTLEEFMLSRQEEERKSEALHHKILKEKSKVYQRVDFNQKENEVGRHGNFNSVNSRKNSEDLTKETNKWGSRVTESVAEVSSVSARNCDLRWGNPLKSVAQYQPPPAAQLDDVQPLTMAFEMHLGEKEISNSKTSKFRNIFASKSNRHNTQKSNHQDVSSHATGTEQRQKTLLRSPRLHRAIFERYTAGSKGSGSETNSNSSSVSSASPVLSPSEWATECPNEVFSQTKPTMGISMLGKRPARRTPVSNLQTSPPVAVLTPDYPGLEYPPVFEPETYTLADASSLRSRPRAQTDKSSM